MKHSFSDLWVVYYSLGTYSRPSLSGEEVFTSEAEAVAQRIQDELDIAACDAFKTSDMKHYVCTLSEWIGIAKENSYDQGYASGTDPHGDSW